MPAWGKSMDDQTIWGMVAFLQTMPNLTSEVYHEAVAQSEGHSHGADMNMSTMDQENDIPGGADVPAPPPAMEATHDDSHMHEHADKQ
jgi:hypothetical protein